MATSVGRCAGAAALLFAAAGCRGAAAGDAATALTVTASDVAPIGGGNAMTLPAQRHVVRLTPGGTPRWLVAVQQDGVDGHGLGFLRSDDDGRSFRYYAPIQNDRSERDTADLVPVGDDVAVVYSFEGPELTTSARHDVYFQWWRYAGGDWSPSPPVRIFDAPTDADAYYRAELARDSRGRLWVQAFRLDGDGGATARIAVSTDGGATFQVEPDLGRFPGVGGGRLLALGARMIFIWDGEDGTSPARFRLRDDGDALDAWGATEVAWSDGIYHGASISAVADGGGGMHFVYKDKNSALWYRHFDGSAFGPATLVEAQGNWELQPAATRVGDDLWIGYNRVIDTGRDDEVRVRRLAGGVLGAPVVLDGSATFKGYPAAIATLPAGSAALPFFWGVTPTASDRGQLALYSVAIGGGGGGGSDGGGGPVDGGAPSGSLFTDDFDRDIAPDDGLGPQWTLPAGGWFTNGWGIGDHDGLDLAAENVAACRDCTVQAAVLTFGTNGGVYLRAPTPAARDRYELVLLPNAHVQLRRVRAGTTTVLADAPSGAASLDEPVVLTLSASGAAPVTLVGKVGGVARVSASDGSAAALASTGYAGLWTTTAGVWFDDFALAAP